MAATTCRADSSRTTSPRSRHRRGQRRGCQRGGGGRRALRLHGSDPGAQSPVHRDQRLRQRRRTAVRGIPRSGRRQHLGVDRPERLLPDAGHLRLRRRSHHLPLPGHGRRRHPDRIGPPCAPCRHHRESGHSGPGGHHQYPRPRRTRSPGISSWKTRACYNGLDPDVSGTITLKGSASDNQRIAAITVSDHQLRCRQWRGASPHRGLLVRRDSGRRRRLQLHDRHAVADEPLAVT